jgi:hypothetical protein
VVTAAVFASSVAVETCLAFAGILRASVRHTDVVSRQGGTRVGHIDTGKQAGGGCAQRSGTPK